MQKPKLTITALRAWLSKQRRDREYYYLDNDDCLMCRFVKAQGFKKVTAFSNCIRIGKKQYRLPERLNEIALAIPHTYFAARGRAAA